LVLKIVWFANQVKQEHDLGGYVGK
jgi:hypothetical protein